MKIIDRILELHADPARRPYWQILLILPVWLLYVPASIYTEWCDRRF